MQFLTQKHDEIVQIEDDSALSKLRQQMQYVNFLKNTQTNRGEINYINIYIFFLLLNYFSSNICSENNI